MIETCPVLVRGNTVVAHVRGPSRSDGALGSKLISAAGVTPLARRLFIRLIYKPFIPRIFFRTTCGTLSAVYSVVTYQVPV
jgi:hypothetical protein